MYLGSFIQLYIFRKKKSIELSYDCNDWSLTSDSNNQLSLLINNHITILDNYKTTVISIF